MNMDCRDKAVSFWEHDVPLTYEKTWRIKLQALSMPCLLERLEKSEDPVLSVGLVFYRHVVASVNPLPQFPPNQPGNYL